MTETGGGGGGGGGGKLRPVVPHLLVVIGWSLAEVAVAEAEHVGSSEETPELTRQRGLKGLRHACCELCRSPRCPLAAGGGDK